MLEILLSLSPVDAPLLMVLLFALSMYPVGILFPGCPCIGNRCCNCYGDDLPEFLIATVEGYADQTPTEPLVTVTITSDCFPNALATFSVLAPGGEIGVDEGPIAQVGELVSNDQFSQPGRREPEEEESAATAFGVSSSAVLLPTWREADPDSCGFDQWEIDEITITSPGVGVDDQTPVFFNINPASPATLGGTLPSAQVWVGREEPDVPLSVVTAAGINAQFTTTLSPTTDINGRAAWEVSNITIDNAGSGYANGEQVLSFSSDFAAEPFSGEVTVDGTGAIQSVTVFQAGKYIRFTGVVEEVEILDRGALYVADPDETPLVATQEQLTFTISQTSPSDGSGAEFEATIDSNPASGTFGKVTGITIENGGDDYLAFYLTNSECCGEHYNGREFKLWLDSRREGDADPVTFDERDACWISHRFCGVGNRKYNRGRIYVRYISQSLVEVGVESEMGFSNNSPDDPSRICSRTFYIEDPGPCSQFALTPVEAFIPGFQLPKITIERGTDYDELYLNPDGTEMTATITGSRACHICCKGLAEVPEEITVTLAETVPGSYPSVPGTYVLPFTPIENNESTGSWVYDGPGNDVIQVALIPCGLQGVEEWSAIDTNGEICDECHKKCFPSIGVSFGGTDWQSSDIGPTRSGGGGCSDCTSTASGAMCAPPSSSYTLQRVGGGDAITATIS